jgi:hypothetical protein
MTTDDPPPVPPDVDGEVWDFTLDLLPRHVLQDVHESLVAASQQCDDAHRARFEALRDRVAGRLASDG